MTAVLSEGLRIVAIGVAGVFLSLAALMFVVPGLGRIFGTKQKANKQ